MRKWRAFPKVRYVNYKKEFPILGDHPYPMFGFQRLWSGRLVYISFKHHTLVFDFIFNFVNDMAGKEIVKGELP